MASMASRDAGVAVVDRWTAELHERVAETLTSVCGAVRQELELAAQPPAPPTAAQVDYDTYNDCCQRFVQYVAANMDTSPYFTQQMDRIILACHSNTSEQVLGSLVTKDVWLRPRGKLRGDESREDRTTVSTGQEAASSVVLLATASSADPVVKAEDVTDKLPVQVEAVKTAESRSRRSVSSTRRDVEVTRSPPSSAMGRKERKRPPGRRAIVAAAPPAKRQRQAEEHTVIEILSTAAEDDGEVSDDEGHFGTETETEDEEDEEMNEDVEIDYDGCDDADDEDWIECGSDEDDGDDSDNDENRTASIREPIPDIVGKLCRPECRSPRQTKAFRERLRKGIRFLDALLCRPGPGKVCSQKCQVLRRQWCQNIGPCKHELCQRWHEVDAHVLCCRNTQCEYSIHVMLHESMHQIEHQHELIDNVREELDERKKELTEANASRLTNPPSRISLLNKQVDLLERELNSELVQLDFYECLKRVNTKAANEAGIDTIAEFAGFQTHYVVKNRTETTTTANGAHVKEDNNLHVAPVTQTVSGQDELLPSLNDAIGKLCYAGQRSQEQTKMVKERLRKSIIFIDAILCKPPAGKVCMRDCNKIRKNRCTKDVPCDNEMCGNWHHAEAHIDNCLNPQCEFKLRIIQREVMYGIQEKQRIVQVERAKVKKKTLALETIRSDEKSAKLQSGSYNLVDTRQQDRFFESQVLQDELDQLKEDLAKEERLLHDLMDKMKELKEKLYTIGIDENDDIIDGFPNFTTHYESKRGSRSHRGL